ncbi:glycosyltransferase family 4 protein [Corynebacterium hindlerae]|uniref:Glycosyltransferase family 4 protein n=1 Tax=Corynebacterium hindlerae TaxID=699041 RepID=A0A7G5FEF6_9CORY|nr:glycosyltransferase family 4 protein [Corynebacterium hindlerae]QMV84997.1 glycosyltransferase family 4 protein [Corynebacterium hindlerae]
MPRVLVVTNDFPPTVGGIQSYVRDFLATLPPEEVVVFASTQDSPAAAAWDRQAPYRVIRWPHRIMLPTPGVAAEMRRLIRHEQIEVVWFAAAAPLAVLASAAKRAGATRVVASTHGHEVGWSMLPGARQVLRLIGSQCDAVTYISKYTLRRFRRAFGRHTNFVYLPSGVDAAAFRRPVPATLDPAELTVTCISRLVPRKGQDSLLAVWSQLQAKHPTARLVIVGEGPYESKLQKQAEGLNNVCFTGRVSDAERLRWLHASDIFAMPARTRGGGLDVEGLGIVYLEAQAAGIPVIAGDSGGAPETVTAESGIVVPGRDRQALENALDALLSDVQLRTRMGAAGRAHVLQHWTWEHKGADFAQVLGMT